MPADRGHPSEASRRASERRGIRNQPASEQAGNSPVEITPRHADGQRALRAKATPNQPGRLRLWSCVFAQHFGHGLAHGVFELGDAFPKGGGNRENRHLAHAAFEHLQISLGGGFIHLVGGY